MLGLTPYQPRQTPLPDHRTTVPDRVPWTLNVESLRLACPGGTPPAPPIAPTPRRSVRRGLRLIKQVEHEQRED